MTRSPYIPPISRRSVFYIGLVILAAFTLGFVLWVNYVRIPQSQSNQNRLNRIVSQLSTLGEQNQAKLKALGQKPVGPPAPSVSAGKATAPPTNEAPVTPAPTYVEQVQPSQTQVDAAVSVYFAVHPPRLPFTTQAVVNKLVPYVTKYLHEHPAAAGKNGKNGATGKDGPPPTEQQIDTSVQTFLPAAVAAYLTTNPPPSGPSGPVGPVGPSGPLGAACDPNVNPDCIGPSGATGPPGPGPTEQQIADAVANYFSAHPLACPSAYTAEQETVTTTTGPLVMYVCVADSQPTLPPASSSSNIPTENPT